jgi:hypothetical protein
VSGAYAGHAVLGQPVHVGEGRHQVGGADGAALGMSDEWWMSYREQQARQRQEAAAHSEAEAEQREVQWQRWRGAVATRLHVFNLRHADHAWQLRNGHGIAATTTVQPHVETEPGGEVRVAGKLFADSDQVQDPQTVLYEVSRVARSVVAAGEDPRVEMSENPEPFSATARYVGVVVSMLDTPDGTWHEVKTRVSSGLGVPGRVMAVLADGSMLLGDRIEHHHPEHYSVQASHRIADGWTGLGRRWRYVPELATLADPATRALWLRLFELNDILNGSPGDH